MTPILIKTENACKNLAVTASVAAELNTNVYTGIGNEDKAAPAIICSATNATEDFPQSGIWHVTTDITVKEIAADTTDKGTVADTIFANFLSGSINQDLTNNESNYLVYDVFVKDTRTEEQGDSWNTTLSLDVVCVLT